MNELIEKKIRFSDAAFAIGVKPKVLRNWLQRNKIELLSDHSGPSWTAFTLGDIAVLAVMRKLIKWGVGVSYANEIALTELMQKGGLLFQYKNTPAAALVELFKQWHLILFGEDEEGDPHVAARPALEGIPTDMTDFLFLNLGLTIETAYDRLNEGKNS